MKQTKKARRRKLVQQKLSGSTFQSLDGKGLKIEP